MSLDSRTHTWTWSCWFFFFFLYISERDYCSLIISFWFSFYGCFKIYANFYCMYIYVSLSICMCTTWVCIPMEGRWLWACVCVCTTCVHVSMEGSWLWFWVYVWTTWVHVPMEGRWLQDAQCRQWELNPGRLQVLLRTKPWLQTNRYMLLRLYLFSLGKLNIYQ